MLIRATVSLLAWARLIVLIGAATALSACAGIYPFQNRQEVLVRIGRDTHTFHTRDYAGHYVPYALLAVRAYDQAGREDDDLEKLRSSPLARSWMAEWRQEFSEEGPFGLGYQVWRRNDCSEIVIAFRGTNFRELGDWISNLRWVTRFFPIEDQYDHVRATIKDIVDRARRRCAGRQPVITAVGHSLGGGLAQQAAYADGRIRLVFAFDPSFVTAYSDTPALSAINSRGLKIDRVYEHGEILAYARFLQRQILPASACDPQIRTVRFNLLDGVPIVQHNMAAITARLIENAGTPITWRARRHAALPNAKEADPKTGKCSVIVVRRS